MVKLPSTTSGLGMQGTGFRFRISGLIRFREESLGFRVEAFDFS